MATVTLTPPVAHTRSRTVRAASSETVFVGAATAAAFLLLGYHPYAEDGGIYAAAAALRLNPSLFPAERAFAIGQTYRSLFVPLVAFVSRALHLPLPATLLLLHVLALAATVATALALARCLFATQTAQRTATLVLAVSLGVPVAGTSLYLCDPYLTARSFSTPLLLVATAGLLRRRYAVAAMCLLGAFALHPIMAAWTAVLFLFLFTARSLRPVTHTVAAGAAVLAAMALLRYAGSVESPAARAAALTRSYWFLAQWQPYEIVGLVVPPALLAWAAWRLRRPDQVHARRICLASVAAVVTVGVGSLLFVHGDDGSLLLARMQPLRLLHTVYAFLALILGGSLGASRMRRHTWVAVVATAAGLIAMQRQTYAFSRYFELPGAAAANQWTQAFQWAGEHTPIDALFALDAHYTTTPGEDAQLFRAIALRSQLPDAAKDGGISSMMTGLAPVWQQAAAAQTGLDTIPDDDRIRRLRPLGASWLVLPATAFTRFDCPYRNAAAKVCRLP